MAASSLSSSLERAVSPARFFVKAWRRHRPSSSEPALTWTLPCHTYGDLSFPGSCQGGCSRSGSEPLAACSALLARGSETLSLLLRRTDSVPRLPGSRPR
eukprot:1779477-Heterocapsa_arctica.AAC.1